MGYGHRELRYFAGGITSSGYSGQAILSGITHDFLDTTGVGLLHWVMMRARAVADCQLMMPIIVVDGVDLQPKFPFNIFNTYGYDDQTKPIALHEYAIDGNCMAIWFWPNGLHFNTSIKISCENGTGGAQVADCIYYLSKYGS